MIEVGPYPLEASFYPEHLFIPLISLLIFVVILSIIASIKKRLIERKEENSKKQLQDRGIIVEMREHEIGLKSRTNDSGKTFDGTAHYLDGRIGW